METNFLSQIILSKIRIKQIVNIYYPEFSSGTGLIRCLNPNHSDSSPSMKVYESTDTVYCFGCGFAGNVISTVAKVEGISLQEAMAKIKAIFDIEEDFSSLPLRENFDLRILKSEFNKTISFYCKCFSKRGFFLSKEEIAELQDIYLALDLKELKKFKSRIKAF